jgi:hypothetical protein
MKIRIRGNSLRLRLLRSEVKQFAEVGLITESIRFAMGQSLVYALEAKEDVDSVTAFYRAGRVSVHVPKAMALEWALSDTISLVAEQAVGAAETLSLLIEKDFTCLNPRAVWQEDQSDNFPNPNPSCGDKHV